MGTFKLHASCTQAMRILQYRTHVDHFQYTQRGSGAAAPPLYISLAWSYVASIHSQAHKFGHKIYQHVFQILHKYLIFEKYRGDRCDSEFGGGEAMNT